MGAARMIIFDLTNPLFKYKGILSAIVDIDELSRSKACPCHSPKDSIIELIAIIWMNEKEEWNYKVRIKFPSGNKQVGGKNLGCYCNETKCLHDIYKIVPMKDKYWFKNPCGTVNGILEILEREEMILSIQTIEE
jgi:hypothetical protein